MKVAAEAAKGERAVEVDRQQPQAEGVLLLLRTLEADTLRDRYGFCAEGSALGQAVHAYRRHSYHTHGVYGRELKILFMLLYSSEDDLLEQGIGPGDRPEEALDRAIHVYRRVMPAFSPHVRQLVRALGELNTEEMREIFDFKPARLQPLPRIAWLVHGGKLGELDTFLERLAACSDRDLEVLGFKGHDDLWNAASSYRDAMAEQPTKEAEVAKEGFTVGGWRPVDGPESLPPGDEEVLIAISPQNMSGTNFAWGDRTTALALVAFETDGMGARVPWGWRLRSHATTSCGEVARTADSRVLAFEAAPLWAPLEHAPRVPEGEKTKKTPALPATPADRPAWRAQQTSATLATTQEAPMAEEETETDVATTPTLASSALATGGAMFEAGKRATRLSGGEESMKLIARVADSTVGAMLAERYPDLPPAVVADLTEFLAPILLHFLCTYQPALVPKSHFVLEASTAAMEAQYFLLLRPYVGMLTDALLPVAELGERLAGERG